MMETAVVTTSLVLLMLVSRGCSFPTEETQCRNEMTVNNEICSELFLVLQKSLVSNRVNLYDLRKIFYPSSKLSPTLLNVSYVLSFKNTSQIPCSNASESIDSSEEIHTNKGWTSQSIYTQIHPATINRLQPQMFYLIMTAFEPKTSTSGTTEASLRWEGIGKFLTLNIFLEVETLPCLPSRIQIEQTLEDITSLVGQVKNMPMYALHTCEFMYVFFVYLTVYIVLVHVYICF